MTGSALLAIDSATTGIVVAIGSLDGQVLAEATWPAGYRHGETLLPAIEALLLSSGLPRTELAAIVVGTGPGAFTGLRVGIATAKGLAHGLDLPILGVSTATALATSAGLDAGVPMDQIVVLLPAGPSDRIVIADGTPPALLPSGTEPTMRPDQRLVAIDLHERADPEACTRGDRARSGLAAALVGIGAARLAAGEVDDLDRLVPDYVTLPRGAAPPSGEVAWSRDHR